MIATKYCMGNIALLLVGLAIAIANEWAAAMTAGFGAERVHDLRSGAIMVVLMASLMLLPAFLITVRWPGLGANVCWSIAGICCLCIWASPLFILFLILAAVDGLISVKIASRSERIAPLRVTPSG